MNRLKLVAISYLVALAISGSAQTIEIHQIDVGTGDAALINVKDSTGTITHSILIDAGETYLNERIIDYLKTNARKAGDEVYLDYIISSHYHSDHIGGLVGQKDTPTHSGHKRRKCGETYTGVLDQSSGIKYFAVLDKGNDPPVPPSEAAKKKPTLYQKYKTLAGIRRITVGSTVVGTFGAINNITAPAPPFPEPSAFLQSLSLGGYIDLGADQNGVGIRLRLILANSYVYDPAAPGMVYNVADSLNIRRADKGKNTRPNANNWGLGWVLEYGSFRYYTAGDVGGYDNSNGTCISCGSNYFDIETPISIALVGLYRSPENAEGHICAQKISHHGSCCSSNPEFLDKLKSSLAVISAGDKFNHPTQEAISRLQELAWHTDSLNYNSLQAFLMTELHYYERDISLAAGSTSGSMNWVATDQAVNPLDVAETYTMRNGQHLYFMNDERVPEIPGDIIIKVKPVNNLNIPISKMSSFEVEYRWYDGRLPNLIKKFNCHKE